MSISLKKQLLSSYLWIAAIALLSVVIQLYVGSKQQDRVVSHADRSQAMIAAHRSLQAGLDQSMADLKDWVLTGEPRYVKAREQAWEQQIIPAAYELVVLLEQLSSLASDRQHYIEVEGLIAEMLFLETRQWQLEDLASNEFRDPMLAEYTLVAKPLNDRLMVMISSMIDRYRQEEDQALFKKQPGDYARSLEVERLFTDLRGMSQYYAVEIFQSLTRDLTNNDIAEIESHWVEVEKTLNRLIALSTGMELWLQESIESYRYELYAFRRVSLRLVELANKPTDPVTEQLNELLTTVDTLERSLSRGLEENQQYYEDSKQAVVQSNELMRLLMILLGGVLVGVTFYQSRLQGRKLAMPIIETTKSIKRLLSNKDSDSPKPVGINELDDLTAAFFKLSSSLLVAEKDLDTSQKYLHYILKNIGEAIVVSKVSGDIVLFNDSAEKLFGYTQENIHNHNVSDLMPDRYAVDHGRYMSTTDFLEGRSALGKTRELFAKDSSGRVFPVAINLQAFNYDEERYYIAAIRDISDWKLIQDELISAKDQAEAANHAKSRFLADMSHDLRTPLNVILGFSQLMEIDPQLNATHKEYVEDIYQAGKLLLRLIDQVLDLSRVESGKLDLDITALDCVALLNKCQSMSLPLAGKHSINLTVDAKGSGGLHVLADETRLLQILFNLISNAIKYNHADGCVEVRVVSVGHDTLRFLVKDNGIGIAEDDQEKVFGAFNRLHEGRHGAEGTGIGLAITQRLVQYMNGEIGFQSRVGEGSEFWVDLPRSIPEVGHKEEVDDELTVAAPDTVLPPMTIVYVEDDLANRRLIELLIQRINKDIVLHTADNALDGLALIRDVQPHIVITDINMPKRDGFWLLHALKGEAVLGDIPVIALSADAMTENIERALQDGFHSYVTKPVDFEVLLLALKKAMIATESVG